MSTVFITSTELLNHFEPAGLTPASLVQSVLECTPRNRKGELEQWPSATHLTVRQVMDQEVWVPAWERSVAGLLVMATVAAEEAMRACLHATGRIEDTVLVSAEQRDEIIDAVVMFMDPWSEEMVQGLLHYQPGPGGLYAPFIESDPDVLEALFASDGEKPRRLLDTDFFGYRLVVWRTARERLALEGERLHDTVALLLDDRGRQAAYVQLRLAVLPPVADARSWALILDAYDALGLELGLALQQAQAGGLFSTDLNPMAGVSVLQLQEMEVRDDLRGQGLGMRMLERVLPLAVRRLKHQPQVFAMAAKPMQYTYPVRGLPGDMMLEALDAAERLAKYFQDMAPHITVASLAQTDILFLGVDARATGSYFQQLDALAEASPACDEG